MDLGEGATVAIKYAFDPQYLPRRNPAAYQELGFCFVFKNKCDLIIYLWKKWKKLFTKLLGFGTLEQLLVFYINNH